MTTSRLILEILTQEDFDLFHQINTNSFVRKYLWDGEIISLDLAKEILAVSEKKYQTEQWGLWKILLQDSKKCIGYIGFWYFFEEDLPQLLYVLLPEYTGRGYATEASAKIVSMGRRLWS